MELKLFAGSVVADAGLGEREIHVVANSGKSDRVKDVLVASGCKLDDYAKNPIVLADHDPRKPIGNFAPEIKDGAVQGVLTFAPKGASEKADEYCALYKAGVMKTVSVGFRPIDYEPNKAGGYDYKGWELMELSCVAVPCDPDAVVTARQLATPSPLVGEGRGGGAPAKTASSWKVGASRNLPLGGDEAWDGPAAEASIWAHCGFDGDSPDTGFARKAFLAYDSASPKLKGSYKLPFAKVVDGRLTAMPSGVRAAASRLPDTDISDEARGKARAVIDHYEAKMGDGKTMTRDAFAAKWGTAPDFALIDELLEAQKAGRVLSEENMEHVKGIMKCFGKMSDCQVKALDSHGTAHADLQAFAQHIETGVEHAKCLMKAGKKPKPKPDPGDGSGAGDGGANDDDDPDYDDPTGDDDDNVELAAAAERRKRALGLVALGPAP